MESTEARERRFWAKVGRRDQPDDCWLWTAGVGRRYGKFSVLDRSRAAHRVSWELFVGPIPDGLWVLHQCDRPLCVNPAHLFLGTHQDNMDDMIAKGRNPTRDRNGSRLHPERRPRGEANTESKLTAESVIAIRNSSENNVALGRRYGVHNTTIQRIRVGLAWAHLPLPGTYQRGRGPRKRSEEGADWLSDGPVTGGAKDGFEETR